MTDRDTLPSEQATVQDQREHASRQGTDPQERAATPSPAGPPSSQREGLVVPPPVDIYETADRVILLADMPGVPPGNLEITIHRGILVIRGRVEEQLHLSELPTRYERSFNLPDAIDQEQLKAEIVDGVLRLEMPKRAQAQPRRINVQVQPRAAGSAPTAS